jgi:trehalose synthase
MLQVLVGYVQDLGIPVGWLVITGDAGFFAITKRLHNQIHGRRSGAPLGAAEADHYAQMLAANAVELTARRPPDWPRRWHRRAPGWCGAATSAWAGKTR